MYAVRAPKTSVSTIFGSKRDPTFNVHYQMHESEFSGYHARAQTVPAPKFCVQPRLTCNAITIHFPTSHLSCYKSPASSSYIQLLRKSAPLQHLQNFQPPPIFSPTALRHLRTTTPRVPPIAEILSTPHFPPYSQYVPSKSCPYDSLRQEAGGRTGQSETMTSSMSASGLRACSHHHTSLAPSALKPLIIVDRCRQPFGMAAPAGPFNLLSSWE